MAPQCNYGVDAEENKNMKLCVGQIDHVCWLNFDMKLGDTRANHAAKAI